MGSESAPFDPFPILSSIIKNEKKTDIWWRCFRFNIEYQIVESGEINQPDQDKTTLPIRVSAFLKSSASQDRELTTIQTSPLTEPLGEAPYLKDEDILNEIITKARGIYGSFHKRACHYINQ